MSRWYALHSLFPSSMGSAVEPAGLWCCVLSSCWTRACGSWTSLMVAVPLDEPVSSPHHAWPSRQAPFCRALAMPFAVPRLHPITLSRTTAPLLSPALLTKSNDTLFPMFIQTKRVVRDSMLLVAQALSYDNGYTSSTCLAPAMAIATAFQLGRHQRAAPPIHLLYVPIFHIGGGATGMG
jgi:hypothetical protein